MSWVMNIDAHAVALLEPLDEVEDLGLGGDVERRGRLVGDQQRRIAGERHGDHGALAHAAGIFERVAVDRPLGIGNLDLAEQFDGALARGLLAEAPVQAEHLVDLVADGVHRRQRRHRLLEDHGDLLAADRPYLAPLGRERGEIHRRAVAAGEIHAAGDDMAGGVDDLQDGTRRDALAGTAFADDGERPPAKDVEGHAVDCLDHAAAHREVRNQIAHAQDDALVVVALGGALCCGRLGHGHLL